MNENDIEWETFGEPVDKQTIHEIETALNVQFPDDFLLFARQYHGGWPNKTDFVYDDPQNGKTERGFEQLVSFDLDHRESILKIYESLSVSHFPQNIIPIGADGGGDYVCLDYRASCSNPVISIWRHDRYVEESVTQIAKNFMQFLAMLYEPTKGSL